MFDKYFRNFPWPLLGRTILLWYTFFIIGITDSVRGPTILDLKDLIKVEVSDISTTLGFRCFGGALGGFGAGFILDHISRSGRYLFISLTFLTIGICTIVLPFCPNLLAMQLISGVFGICSGAFHTGTNVLLLDIWKNRDPSPILYMMHFCFAIGGLIAPIIAKPFLQETSSSEDHDADEDTFWTIKTLYSIIGMNIFITIPFYIYYSFKEASINRQEDQNEAIQTDVKQKGIIDPKASKLKSYCLIILMVGYYLFFAGLENSFRSFTATFAVTSSLNLSRHQGSDVQAVFYSTFAIVRFLIIFLSKGLSPTATIWTSTTLLILGTVSLSIWAESSVLCLKIGVALAGAGVASMFASGLLWFKESHPVSNRIGAVFVVSCGSAGLTYTLFVGHFIETHPMMFPYVMTGSVAGLGIIFGIANLLTASMKN